MAEQMNPAGPPPLALAMLELWRAGMELSALPWAAPVLGAAPRGDGHPVLVLPGFTAGDRSTVLLRRYLSGLGYEVHPWKLGRNYDHYSVGARGGRLAARIRAIHEADGRKVSLIGWSLGGMLAREAARHDPDSVRQVITLGSPFHGDPHASNAWRAFEAMTGQRMDSPAFARRMAAAVPPPPVPSTSIFSKSDGIVAWRNCLEAPDTYTDNIEVCGSHCGLVVNPPVLYAIADRLAQPEDAWAPFHRDGWRAAFYPSSGHPSVH
jgi:pimeloyl-ACP methyl ester carboxylesterase